MKKCLSNLASAIWGAFKSCMFGCSSKKDHKIGFTAFSLTKAAKIELQDGRTALGFRQMKLAEFTALSADPKPVKSKDSWTGVLKVLDEIHKSNEQNDDNEDESD